jgi:hypothetical protein
MRPKTLDSRAPQADGKLRSDVEQPGIGCFPRGDVLDVNKGLGVITRRKTGKNAFRIHVAMLARASDTHR